jgi:hypothetical protein
MRPWICFALGIVTATLRVQAQGLPPEPAGKLVREVIWNELRDHREHGYWRYWVEKRSEDRTVVADQVETSEGPVMRLLAIDGREPSMDERRADDERLQRLLSSPEEQARSLRKCEEDEERIGRILALLPDAFLFEYAGADDGRLLLRFRPNPDYPARSIEARVFHAMSGEIRVDAQAKRLSELEGRVEENVDFGFGILGRLYKGGWFRLVRRQVSATDWKTAGLEVHMNIRSLLVKNFARETSEERGGFEPVLTTTTLAEAAKLLNQNEQRDQAWSRSSDSADATHAARAAFAFRP